MLHPFTLLLWALFHSIAPHPTSESAEPSLSSSSSSTMLQATKQAQADSSIFQGIKEKFEGFHKHHAREKLYVQFDRSLLKPGETLWFNAYLLNAGNLLPSIQSQMLQVDLLSPQGAVIQSKKYLALNGQAAGDFDFPGHLPGGLYKIKAYTNWMLNFSEVFEREITLQNVVLPRINLKLEFERKGIGPGGTAIARLDAQSLDNKPVAAQKVRYSAAVAGNNFHSGEVVTDANGRAFIRFQMPDTLESSDGLLLAQLEYGGQNEAISRPIPIALNKIDLQFFPEGGHAVVGLATRMAFKAVNEFGKPADVEGTVHDSQGNVVATFSSFHDGMGAFEFFPTGGMYEARLTKPYVSDKAFPLPIPERAGVCLNLEGRTNDRLRFAVKGSESSRVLLIGQAQDKLFFSKEINLNSSAEGIVEAPTGNLPMGIVRFTLFDMDKTALAERLVFVNRDKGLKIDIKPDKEKYLPREKVTLNIRVADHEGKPVQGKFSLGVTDESLLTFADDKQGHLLSSLLLEQEVKGKIEEPNFYFDAKEPKSEQALDYLLMTQGWRRFEWKQVLEQRLPGFVYQPERAEITGTVLNKKNAPAAGVKVQLYPNGPVTQTNKAGNFSFQNLPANQYYGLQVNKKDLCQIYGYGNYLVQPKQNTTQFAPKTRQFPSPGGQTLITGNILDDLGDPLIGATVMANTGNDFVRGAITDIEGNFSLAVPEGRYTLEVHYTGYQSRRFGGIKTTSGKTTSVRSFIMGASNLQEVVINAYKVPLIEQDKNSGGQTLTSEQIRSLPVRSVNAIVATSTKQASIDVVATNVKGSRSSATQYYVDGIRVGRSDINSLPLSESVMIAYRVPVIDIGNPRMETTFSSALLVPRASSSGRKQKKVPVLPTPYYYNQLSFSQSREFYVPTYGGSQMPRVRSDFRPTIYWNPSVQTNSQGEAAVEFYSSDAITNFRATLEGLGAAGQPGHCEKQFYVQKPVSIGLKLPSAVTEGDVLNLQVSLANNLNYSVGGNLGLTVPGHFQAMSAMFQNGNEFVQVPAGETKILTIPFKIGRPSKVDQVISLELSADEIKLDAFEGNVRTMPAGFPAGQVIGGFGPQTSFDIRLNSPLENSVSATLTAYPNPLADVLAGMERMIRQPHGCFEQVSSSNYPNLLVLDLLRKLDIASPETEARAMGYLEIGYKKLSGYESKSGGFEFYGRDPADERLTAYGILQFTDMAKVFPVDQAMISRSIEWLQSRRNGDGSWNNAQGRPLAATTSCYMAWALAEAGYGEKFAAQIEAAQQTAIQSGDPYQLALAANALLAKGDPRGKEILDKWVKHQEQNGSWIGKTHSALYGQGQNFRIETTALTALAMMKAGERNDALARAIEFLAKAKTEYGYGSTQSTVFALKALIQYAGLRDRTVQDGGFSVMVDGKSAGSFKYSTQDFSKLEVPDLNQYFSSNNPKITVVFDDGAALIPYDLEIVYTSLLPQDAPGCSLSLSTSFAQHNVNQGETLRLSAELKSTTDKQLASPMLVIGIPSGASLQPWQLKKLVDEGKCAYYELWEGYAVFHFDRLAPHEARVLNLDLLADISGTFDAPASQAFLYYSNDQRVWSKPGKITIR